MNRVYLTYFAVVQDMFQGQTMALKNETALFCFQEPYESLMDMLEHVPMFFFRAYGDDYSRSRIPADHAELTRLIRAAITQRRVVFPKPSAILRRITLDKFLQEHGYHPMAPYTEKSTRAFGYLIDAIESTNLTLQALA